MLELAVIVNPASGRGRGEKVARVLEDRLQKRGIDYQLFFTRAPGHATELAASLQTRFSSVVAVGGDGTINEVVNGLVDSGTLLGIIPVGTGNDFVRAAGIPTHVGGALEIILQGHYRTIDLGRVNNRYFVNGIGIGFDAWVVKTALTVKRLKGNLLYLYSVLRTLKHYRGQAMRLSLDGRQMSGAFFMITIANGTSMGGGFKLTPNAQLDDGLLDVCLIDKMPIAAVLQNLLKVYKGAHQNDPRVSLLQAREVDIRVNGGAAIHADGELLSTSCKNITVSVKSAALNLYTPKNGK